MKNLVGLGLVLSAIGAFAACGGDAERAGSIGSGASSSRGGSTSRGGAASEGGAAGEGAEPSNPLAPVVIILEPSEVDDPNDGGLITAGELEVICSATQSGQAGSSEVDPASVHIELLDEEGNVVADAAGVPSDEDDTFSATLTVPAGLPNGPVRVRCSASDTSEPPLTGGSSVDTFLDQGPTINAIEPQADSAHPLEGVVSFEFEVLPAPVASGDDGAEISDVTLDVNGVPIDTTKDGDTYSADVDFTDPVLFPETPDGSLPVLIRATNTREPDPITRTLGYPFTIDGNGPTITVTSHKSFDVVGGQVELQFTVSDDLSGVNRNSVAVEVNTENNPFEAGESWSEANGNYSFTFDSRNIQTSTVQITVNIRASDTVGNESAGASLTLWIDNTPPAVDLDAAIIREVKVNTNNSVCSQPFDPLGIAVSDEEEVGPIETFRALVWERANYLENQTVLHFAGTDVTSVYLYLQTDPGTPLLVDTDEDNVCDELDVDGLPLLQLQGITPIGSSWYGNTDPTGYPDPALFGCDLEAGNAPVHLCPPLNNSDMTRVIKHDWEGTTPVVFAKPELTGVECTGQQWELGPFVETEGWVCLAARARDRAGNIGISRPLRVCYDNPAVGGTPACATMSTTPPSCTDSCAAPSQLELLFVRSN